jgi:hypothetical protein
MPNGKVFLQFVLLLLAFSLGSRLPSRSSTPVTSSSKNQHGCDGHFNAEMPEMSESLSVQLYEAFSTKPLQEETIERLLRISSARDASLVTDDHIHLSEGGTQAVSWNPLSLCLKYELTGILPKIIVPADAPPISEIIDWMYDDEIENSLMPHLIAYTRDKLYPYISKILDHLIEGGQDLVLVVQNRYLNDLLVLKNHLEEEERQPYGMILIMDKEGPYSLPRDPGSIKPDQLAKKLARNPLAYSFPDANVTAQKAYILDQIKALIIHLEKKYATKKHEYAECFPECLLPQTKHQAKEPFSPKSSTVMAVLPPAMLLCLAIMCVRQLRKPAAKTVFFSSENNKDQRSKRVRQKTSANIRKSREFF